MPTIPFTIDPMFLTRHMLQRIHGDHYDRNETHEKSTRFALSDILYHDGLSDDDLNTLWEKWQEKYDPDNQSDTINMSGDLEQYKQLFEFLFEMDAYKTAKKKNALLGVDHDYCVVDKQEKVIEPCEFGGHYNAVHTLINRHHSDMFKALSPKEQDDFIFENFELIGTDGKR